MRTRAFNTWVATVALAFALATTCAVAATPEMALRVSAAPSSPAPDGWGPIRLRMTPDQVRALSEYHWSETTPFDRWFPGPVIDFDARDPVELYGSAARLNLEFRNGVLNLIMLIRELGEGLPALRCDEAFEALIKQAEASYGPFAPVDAVQPRQLHDYAYESVSVERVVGAASSFSRRTTDYRSYAQDPGTPADVVVYQRAQHRSARTVIEVWTSWSVRDGVENCSSVDLLISPHAPNS